MSKQTINIGASPNDGTGTPLRTSFDYTNQNFTELYNALGGGVGLPGSANQIIFNNGSSLAGDADLFWNSTLNFFTVTGSAIITADLTVDGGTLKVDSTNNFVGINKTPVVALDVSGSATITGDLTVRTNKLKVDATGVGIGTASPSSGTLNINSHFILLGDSQTKIGDNGLVNGVSSDGNSQIQFFGGKSLFFNEGANNTKMTLNSTGLGVGKTPSARLDVASARAASVVGGIIGTTGTGVVADECQFLIKNVNTASGQNNGAGIGGLLEASASNKSSLLFYVDNGTAVTNVGRFDSNGNLLVGTTSTSGSSSNAASVVLGSARSADGIVSAPTAVATTIFTITPALYGRYEVLAMSPVSGNAALYTSIATVIWDGSTGRVVANNGTNLTITLSGSAVQITQISGSTVNIYWSFLRISLV